MQATNEFFLWFYYGLSGLGGWFIFLLIALIAVAWLIYDSSTRRLRAIGWRMAVILAACLMLPALLYRFTVTDLTTAATSPLAPFAEVIFYLGLLGGVLPFVLDIGYFVTFHGMVGCANGHVYEEVLGQCPECARLAPQPASPAYYPEPVAPPAPPSVVAPAPHKPKVQAWLNARDGHSYQLYQGETTVGRSLSNDICFKGDSTIGRTHAKIMEQGGRFRLLDLGSKNFTRVNGRVVREPVLLEQDDEIQFGDNTVVNFITSRR